MDQCQWKLVASRDFTLGVNAARCGEAADVSIIRPQRKKDLLLCEEHFNAFIAVWGLSHQVRILCRCEGND